MASVDFFKDNAKNKNTTKATNTWYRNFVRWANSAGKPTNIEAMEKSELNSLLEVYFAQSVRLDQKQFEPSSLGNMQAGIDRYLREKGCMFSIIKDIEFAGSRDVLEGRGKYLREQFGMGKKPNAADSFSREEENMLWESGQLGTHSGEALVNTVHMLLTKHLGLRGRQEHHSMRVEDFVFKMDDNGDRYVTFKEASTKTRPGGVRQKTRKSIPKMFETRIPGRCPVQIFETFLLKRPVHMRSSGKLYLAIINNPQTDVWFKISNLGVNYINDITKKMVRKSPLETTKKLTNHAWRKTTTKQMRKAGASRSEIIEVTGHTNKRGLDPYDSGDEFQQKKMSYAIDGLPAPIKPTSVPPPRAPSHTQTSATASPSVPPTHPHSTALAPPLSSTLTPTLTSAPSSSLQIRSEAIASSQVLREPNFRMMTEMFEKSESKPTNVYNFYGCKVRLDSGNDRSGKSGPSSSVTKTQYKRKRVVIMSSDESSQSQE